MSVLGISGDQFTMAGQPVRILSGAIHYFRVVPEYWRDRLLKLKACGLNTVETYVPWNLHEPRPGEFCFSGMLDIERFIGLAAELDLMVIIRPGPYICAEWEFGGLPAWLLADPAMKLRCSYPPYLDAVDRFFGTLLPRLVPWQSTRGGPIVAMQVENEYGSYGNDKAYLRHLEASMRSQGVDVLLITSDGATDSMLQGGTLPHLLKTANFGSAATRSFAKLREYQPTGPLMCCEFWNGWFDHWGEEHHRRDPEDAAATLDEMLAAGASVNVFVFHGGTSFGFMNGANHTGTQYQPTVGSYDYDAALDEAGNPTAKFHAFREVMGKYAPLPASVPASSAAKAFGQVTLVDQAELFASLEDLSQPIRRPTPEPMEMLGQNYGFILYRTKVGGPREPHQLVIQHVRDRALVFVAGEYQGVVDRNEADSDKLILGFEPGEYQLDILVENMGRVNYGPLLHDRKGITEGVRLGNQFLYDWDIFCLPLSDLTGLRFGPLTTAKGPSFYRGTFEVDHPADTFLALPGWSKGVCYVNGFNLGRYWERGPQRTLYVPGPLLRRGSNELIVFELHDMAEPMVEFRDCADLG